MTTIGSSNPYYASLFGTQKTYAGKQDGSEDGSDFAAPQRQPQSAGTNGGMTDTGTLPGAKLASALWSMESQGVEIDQPAIDASLGETPSTAVEDEFMALAKKTFAERIREQYLKSHDLTEDDLKAMSPDDRSAIEADIRKAMLEAMGVNDKAQNTAMTMGAGAAADQAGAGLAGEGQPGAVSGTGAATRTKTKDDTIFPA